jgi:molecular chaperone GrpE (heat shock protein)
MENKKTKTPAIKTPKVNPEIEKLKGALTEQELINKELLSEIKELEGQLEEYYEAVAELHSEVESYKNASFFTKLKNLF